MFINSICIDVGPISCACVQAYQTKKCSSDRDRHTCVCVCEIVCLSL